MHSVHLNVAVADRDQVCHCLKLQLILHLRQEVVGGRGCGTSACSVCDWLDERREPCSCREKMRRERRADSQNSDRVEGAARL